jgi:DNA polymerase-1
MRGRAKAVNFGILYGIGEYSLSKDIGSSLQEARHIIEDYNRQFPSIREYLDRTIAEAKRTGYVETLFGRRRSLPELASPNRSVRSFGERAAMNTPLQGAAADIIKIAMVRTSDALHARGMKTRLVLQVHDELILESPADEVDEASRLLRDCMEKAADLSVPLRVDVHAGASWYETK